MKLDPKMALLGVSASKNNGYPVRSGRDRAWHGSTQIGRSRSSRTWPGFGGAMSKAKEKQHDVLAKVPSRRLDFDDLLLEALLLLRDDATIRARYQSPMGLCFGGRNAGHQRGTVAVCHPPWPKRTATCFWSAMSVKVRVRVPGVRPPHHGHGLQKGISHTATLSVSPPIIAHRRWS